MKISLITPCFNAEKHIGRCIESVIAQNYDELEYIIIDGGSTDNTLTIINQYKSHLSLLISEPDLGLYDAINKGIRHAAGDIVGVLNADDVFAAGDALTTIANAFDCYNADISYGDLNYVNPDETIIRKWRTRPYIKGLYNWGWMPPHPTFYCKKELFDRLGYYSLEYGTAADYELMLRFMHPNNLKTCYINSVIVSMQSGGMSNKSPISRIKAWRNDYKAMKDNNIIMPLLTLIMKPVRKISQFF